MLRTAIYFIFSYTFATALSPAFAADNNNFEITTIHSNASGVLIEYDMNGLELSDVVIDQNSFTTVTIPGEGFTYEQGMPILPMVSRTVIVPPTAGIELRIEAGEPVRIAANHPPMLCIDEEVYPNAERIDLRQRGLYPPEIAKISEPTIIRGIRFVKITTYPVQYDPETEEFLHYQNLQTELVFNNQEPINPVLHPDRRNRSREFLKFVDAFAANSDVLDRDDVENIAPYAGHYLIVGHENTIMPAKPFIEWRRKAGYKVDIYPVPANRATQANSVLSDIQDRYDAYLDDGEDPFDQILIIGDRQNMSGHGPATQWQIQSFTGVSNWGNPPHADYKFGLLEGRDEHMDVAVSRWASGGDDLMALHVGRTLAYEAEPEMEDTTWFTRGGVGSYHWGNGANTGWHVTVNTNVRWAYELLQQQGYDDVRFYEEYDWDQIASNYGPWIDEVIEDGSNIILSRAECYNWTRGGYGVRNDVFPIRLTLSGHGEWGTWRLMRTLQGNGNLWGAVASSCGWGGPQTTPMSVTWLNLVKGVMNHDLTFGWGRVFAVTNFENYYENYQYQGRRVYDEVKTVADFYGDPGIQPWRGVPQNLEIVHVESISPLTKMVEVYAFDPDAEGNPPFEGARITLYVPGDLPDGRREEDEYAEHEVYQITKFSDSEGMVRFVFEDDPQFEEGTMYITLTGRDLLPVFGEIEIEEAEVDIETVVYTLIEIEGNDDENVNPGEIFNLTITATNVGDGRDDIEGVTAIVSSLSPWVDVEENEVNFGTIERNSEVEGEGDVVIHINQSCPDGRSRPSTRPILQIEYQSGDDRWISALELDPYSPNFTVSRFPDGIIIPTEMINFDIELKNTGRLDSAPLTGEITTLEGGVSVVVNTAFYPNIDAGDEEILTDERDFRLSGNTIYVPGSMTRMELVLTSDNGFIDTTYFSLQVRESDEGHPQGPDGYGYICFDDTDTDWDIAPEYDWIEIAMEENGRDYDGVEIEEFDGRSEHNVGETEVIDLQFETSFYGQLFDQISVCTNGYICIGDQGEITNFQNWPMDEAIGGGAGMIAPFWDWLRFSDDSKVYYYYSEEEAIFIVEWYKMRHRSGGNGDLTFQVILYDHAVWVTESGDQNILFQYKTINQTRGPGAQWNDAIPYASVGISSLDGTTGINYTFNNQYPITSAPLENQRALFFSTSPRYKACYLWGNVIDVATGAPIAGAIVSTEHGFTTITDENGDYEIIDALAEVTFDITARAQGYNDSTQYEFYVEEDDSLEINFALLHPAFTPTTYNLSARLDPDRETEVEFSIQNTGNGPLMWNVDRRLIGDANADQWDFRRDFLVGEALDDARIYAVLFIDRTFYIAGANDGNPTIYRLDPDGELIDTLAQPGDHNRGIKDMTYDGEHIWAPVRNVIYKMNLSMEVIDSFEAPYNPTSAITWDSDREVLWCAGTVSNPVAMDRDGNQIDDLEIRRNGMRIYGLSYFKDDPDNAPLYIFHKQIETNLQTIHKYNFETEDTIFVSHLEPEAGGNPKGCFITNTYDVYSWVFMSISDDNLDDRIDIWQIDARRDWFMLDVRVDDERHEAESGILQTGEIADYILTLNATELPETTFVSELFYTHNADSGRGYINIELEVIGAEPPNVFDLAYPADGDTLDTTAVAFTWFPSIDFNFYDTTTYVTWFVLDGDTLSFAATDTSLAMVFDSLEYNIEWMYENPTEWWVQAFSGEDDVESAQHHSFYIKAAVDTLNLTDPLDGLPVEFSIAAIYPNPFNSSTRIRFGIDSRLRTSLRVYDVMGREVAVLYDGVGEIGWKTVVWDANFLSSGVYIFKLESEGRVKIAKTALLR